MMCKKTSTKKACFRIVFLKQSLNLMNDYSFEEITITESVKYATMGRVFFMCST